MPMRNLNCRIALDQIAASIDKEDIRTFSNRKAITPDGLTNGQKFRKIVETLSATDGWDFSKILEILWFFIGLLRSSEVQTILDAIFKKFGANAENV